MNVIFAIEGYHVVGCLDATLYQGAEYHWPNGWRELLDQGIKFDQIDSTISDTTAKEFIDNFKPAKKEPDWTVTEVKLANCWESVNEDNDIKGGFDIMWSTVSAGFGHMSFYYKADKVVCDSDGRDKEFIKQVFNKLVDDLDLTQEKDI